MRVVWGVEYWVIKSTRWGTKIYSIKIHSFKVKVRSRVGGLIMMLDKSDTVTTSYIIHRS